ncbi:UNVERIFIED_ORG: hypothetical protein M2348_001283 [Sphingomonas sp. R1F5B]
MGISDKEQMRLNVRKELHLNPWDLVCALRDAGLVDDDCCMPEVKIVEKTEVNEGRTVIVSWSKQEQRLALPSSVKGADRG